MYKWGKYLMMSVVGLAICLLALHFSLRWISSTDWMRRWTISKIENATGKNVRLGQMVLSLRGAALRDFALAKEGGFAQGEMFRVRKLTLKISFWHLLHGHLKIKAVQVAGIALHLVQDEQGKLNFLWNSEPEAATEEDSSGFFPVSVEEFSARDVHVSYQDKRTNFQITFEKANLWIRNFGWNRDFEVQFTTDFHAEQNGQTLPVSIGLIGRAHLANGDWQQARAVLKKTIVRGIPARVQLSGEVSNLIDPDFTLHFQGEKISDQTLAIFSKSVPEFFVSSVTADMQGKWQAEKQLLEVTRFAVTGPGLEFSAQGSGKVDGSSYDFQGKGRADIKEFVSMFAQLEPYRAGGKLALNARGTQKQLTAQFSLKEGTGQFPQTGSFADVQLEAAVQESMDFKKGQAEMQASGQLNANPFEVQLDLSQTPQEITAGLKAWADRVILPQIETPAAAEDQTVEPLQETTKTQGSLPPITLKADVRVGELSAPYLNGKDFEFLANLSGVTPALNTAHGDLALSVNKGEITDLYHLTNSNPLMKVLFFSLGMVGKVFNSLDVLSVLEGLTGGTKAAGSADAMVVKQVLNEEGELVEVQVPAVSRKIEGKMPYEKFRTQIQFDQGNALIKEGYFVSDTMSFQVTGNADFNTEKLDMTVQAAPGKHETDGIMPLTLRIGGTLNEPQGDMRVIGSVASLITQSVTNNFASRAVKKGLGGLWGLFKKKPAETTPSENPPSPEN